MAASGSQSDKLRTAIKAYKQDPLLSPQPSHSYDSLSSTTQGALSPTLSRLFEPVKDKLKGQNEQQRLQLLITVPATLFQMLASSFLLLTVPQLCDDNRACTITQNTEIRSPIHACVLGFNAVTAAVLLFLSLVEVQRENILVEYLEVSQTLSFSSSAVKERLSLLKPSHETKLHRVDGVYRIAAILALFVFGVNGVASAYVIKDKVLNLQTFTTFATHTLLQIGRLASSSYIAWSESYIFLSAFLSNTVQFNDVDPHYIANSNYVDDTFECEMV
jgi:hypothetical protein